jgi:predicted ribosome quality control (RQC) complex YloA/Tae2 family protein
MYKNYYFLNRYIIELKPYLTGKPIMDIFSQEKDKIIVQIDHNNEQFIEISVNPVIPYLSLKNNYHRAKRNTISFFNQLSDSIINDILIASDDRIILISTNKGNIYFTIRGQNTNVFVFSNNTIYSFKKVNKDILLNYRNEFQDKVYINYFNLLEKDVLKGKSIEQIRKNFPFVGKEIENEIKLRSHLRSDDGELIQDILKK